MRFRAAPAQPRSAFAAVAITTICIVSVICPTGARPAALPPYAKTYWSRVSEDDLRAAARFLEVNHPGAAPSAHDLRFQRLLRVARRQGLARARSVVNYEGYVATMAGFADAFGDRHIWSHPKYLLRPKWAGLLTAKRNNGWVVVDAAESSAELVGAELEDCDGISADALARNSLGRFRVDWSVEAQQEQAAPFLLVDEGNPFLHAPGRCTFLVRGARRSVDLVWREIGRGDLAARTARASGAGAAGFGVREAGKGIWIALGDLSDAAAPVVEEVERRRDEFGHAAFVVLDLRGDQGGSSAFGRRIATAILEGDPASPGEGGPACPLAWRISAGNLRQLQHYVDDGRQLGAAATSANLDQITRMRTAAAHRHDLSGPLTCDRPAGSHRDATQAGPASFPLSVYVLTDNRCFSSCLTVVDLFRALGAVQLGKETDAATHFREVREEQLPSGLSTFSTLQAIAPSSPWRYGPFVPARRFSGDMSDTAAVERWVQEVAGDAGSAR